MARKKYKRIDSKIETVRNPLAIYKNTGVTFSTLETQGDILLKSSMEKSPAERLILMNILNQYAYKNLNAESFSLKNARIYFSSYEYIP